MASGFLPWIHRGAEPRRVLVCATGLARLTLEPGFNQFFISLSLLGCWSLWVFSRRRNLCRCNQFKRFHKLFLSITLRWRWISIFIWIYYFPVLIPHSHLQLNLYWKCRWTREGVWLFSSVGSRMWDIHVKVKNSGTCSSPGWKQFMLLNIVSLNME